MLCALIMAGGRGERFWPLSTDEKPKQFLNLLGEESMLQMTVNRIKDLVPLERIFIVTGKSYADLVKEQLPNLPDRNIIIEPVGRNTAPCIALSAFVIDKYYKDSVIAVLPSDHLIIDEEMFRKTLQAGYEFISENNDAIITLGMKPTRPDTGYGYIKYKSVKTINESFQIRTVDKFVEKPNLETAVQYLKDGNFLWNGGMFIWKSSTILKLNQQYLNKNYQILNEIAASDDKDFEDVLEEKYNTLDSISVDCGIMEKADNIYVIPSNFGWDDVGTWNSVERIREKNSENNIFVGQVQSIKSSNNIVFSEEKPIVIVGLDNTFIVETKDLIYVANKNTIDDIKEIKSKITLK